MLRVSTLEGQRTCVGDTGFTGKAVDVERDISVVHDYVCFLPQEPRNVEGQCMARLVFQFQEYINAANVTTTIFLKIVGITTYIHW